MTKVLAVLFYFCKIYPFVSDIIIGFRNGVNAEKERLDKAREVKARVSAQRAMKAVEFESVDETIEEFE